MVGIWGRVARDGNVTVGGKGEISGSGNLWVRLPVTPRPQLPPAAWLRGCLWGSGLRKSDALGSQVSP